MDADKGRLYYATGIDNTQLRVGAAESRSILQSIGSTAKTESAGIDAAFGKIGKAAGGVFALSQATEFAKKIIEVRGEIESLEDSFETLLGGNKEKAAAMFGEIRQFAVQTPMMLKDLAQGAQTMLAFNIEAEKVMPMLHAIGDISMGDAQKFNSLTLAFSQMSATGKLMGQDLLQMINAGFNPLSVISDKTGKSIGDLKEEMEKGKISTQMVTDAFISATSAGGKFYGMLEKQSKGIKGAISNLKGAIDDMYNGIGTVSQDGVSVAIDGATYLVKHYQEVAEILAVIVGTYGVYKAAVITNEALIQAQSTVKSQAVAAAYAQEMEALSALIPAKEAETQTTLQQAVAAGHITQEKAASIAALRAEIQAQVEALAAQEAAAKARMVAAQSDVQTSLKWQSEIENSIKVLEEEADALFESGDSIAFEAKQEEIAAAKAELLAVQKEQAAAAEAAETAVNEMNAASHQQSAIAATEDAAATNINTAATTTNTGATSALTIAKTKLIGVVRTLYAAISAHPFALAAAATAALAYGIYKVVTYETEAEKAQKRLNEAVNDSEGAWAAERLNIDVMFDRLRKAKEGTEEYEKAKQKILDQYGNYLTGLSDEISSLKDVEAAYNAVTVAANESARARAMDAYIKKEGDEYAKQYSERFDKMYDIIKKKKGQAFADAHRDDINDVISGKKNWSQDFLSQFDEIRSVYMGQYAQAYTYTDNALSRMTEQARTGESDYTKLLEDARKRFGLSNKETEKSEAEETKPEVQNKKYWETQKKNAETELAALTTIEAAGAKGQALRNKIAGFDKKLGLYSVSSSSKSGNNAQENADMLVNEAAQRRKQEEEYARQLADQQKDFEFEIRQARIDAMKEGIEKEMAQNELNYDRLKAQNQRRERDMLDALADEQIRLEEDANPYLFKRKNKDGKWEEDPGKREERYREIRASITIDELDPTQQKQLEEFGRVAAKAYDDANKKSIDSMLADFMTYEQQRTNIAKEYAKKRADLYEKNEDGSVKTDADGNQVMRKGVTQGNIEELNRQEDEALKAIDEQFASREETYQAWCNSIANLTLTQLNELLTKAQKELDDLEAQESAKPGSVDAKKLATTRAKVNTVQAKVNQANAQEAVSPGKRTVKEWEDLYKTLNEVNDSFEEIGDTVGGVAGDIISECGKIATSSLSMINGIMTLANWSVTATQMTAQGASKSIQTVEKASVILTVISAALQIAMQIASLIDFDKSHEKRIEEIQDSVDNLQYSYDQLGREIDKTFGKDASALIDQQTQMLENQKKLIQMQIAEEEAKKSSDDDRIKEWRNQLKELNNDIEDSKAAALDAIFGEDINSAIERLADGLTDAWGEGKEGAQSARDAVRTMMQQMVSTSIKAAMQSAGQMERIRLKLKEFYEDNVLQPWEQQQIYDMAEQLQKELDAQYGWSKSLFETDDEEERSAAQKGIASASQDSVDELNGRATAIQGHTFSISENTKLLLSTVQAILLSVMNIESETNGFGGRLERIEDNIKTMTNTLDDIATRGIRMKN